MNRLQILKSALIGGASVLTLVGPAAAKVFDIPDGDLSATLDAYVQQSNAQIIYIKDVVRGHKSHGAKGDYTETAALTQILKGTGFTAQTMPSNAIEIVPAPNEPKPRVETIKVAAAAPRAPAPGAIETVVVTAQKKSENIQNVPIAVTALSQQQLTERQIAGGPDLLRDVPNMNFGKTNFTGYSIELRGIGTQAISVTTDPAVAVAFNDIPFIRNHFFEQEFYDLSDVEVLRGPQGTLYGRNATAGVVNLKSALPDDSYQAMLSADLGNYSNRRLEAMLNIPVVGDKLDIRVAGEWTKRDGYSFNSETDRPIDGRDLWSTRLSIGWKPTANLQTYLIWEHFSEDDDRLRSGKQLCKTAPNPDTIDGIPVQGHYVGVAAYDPIYYVSQGCEAGSLYSPDAFGVPNGYSLAYASAIGIVDPAITQLFNPYASTTQSSNLRVIQSALDPTYRAKNDTLEWNTTYNITSALTLTSQTGYNNDYLRSAEDYNRFNTQPGIFIYEPSGYQTWQSNTISPDPSGLAVCVSNAGGTCGNLPMGTPCSPVDNFSCDPAGVFCDPQLGCSDRLVAEDLSDERAWQFSQELRLSSNFSGPFNFSGGGNYLHYETVENYYVFINTLTHLTTQILGGSPSYPILQADWVPGVSDNSQCIPQKFAYVNAFAVHDPQNGGCSYIDPNPLSSLNNEGHNYFLSQNPYVLNSYALFGEMYYDVAPDLKLIAGARWTDDRKHFLDIPSELLVPGYGYPVTSIVDQAWNQWTGRGVVNWTPKLDFTDQTLIYGSYAHGYKAGGANPPGATLLTFFTTDIGNPIHPVTFKPEFIDAFEIGTKNSLLDDSVTVDGDIFYYAYRGYQISEIVDRTAINNNYNASVKGAELEANWEPIPGLKFGLTGGYENATANHGDSSIDLMDRTAGHSDWMVMKPFITQASNCILPKYVVAGILNAPDFFTTGELIDVSNIAQACENAYQAHIDPVTLLPYSQNPSVTAQNGYGYIPPGYPGFDPLSVDPAAPANVNNGLGLPPNNGEGFTKDLSGHQLPNAPHFTTSLTAEYSMPVSEDWVGTIHADFYWQSQSWARIFNDRPYDKLHGYSNVNLSLILTNENGWQVMGYVKNVFDTTAITGDFLNSDDSGLTTNVFLTDPRLYGVRVTKQLDQNDGFWGSDYSGYDFFTGLFSDADNGEPPLWIELGGGLDRVSSPQDSFGPPFLAAVKIPAQQKALDVQSPPRYGFEKDAKVSYRPAGGDWILSASVRYGRSNSNRHKHHQTSNPAISAYLTGRHYIFYPYSHEKFADGQSQQSEQHVILDFEAGKDLGLGMLGLDGTSTLSGGIRIAQFQSRLHTDLRAEPDVHYPSAPITNIPQFSNFFKYQPKFHDFHLTGDVRRNFHGIGPRLSWDASMPVAGDSKGQGLTLDWSINGAVLFGRQSMRGHHQTTVKTYAKSHLAFPREVITGQNGRFDIYFVPITPAAVHVYPHSIDRTREVAVPDLGTSVGLSYRYQNAKVSFGYRADYFLNAMDGGIDTRKSENLGFFGPYANISIGIGG